jgi:hypothetical protein
MIYRPKTDRTYVVEFRMADGDALAIASALRNDVGKGLASGFVSLPYRSITELRECDLDVVGSATQRGVVIYIPGPDLVGQVNDDLHEMLRAWVLERHVIATASTRNAAGATAAAKHDSPSLDPAWDR